MGNTIEFTLAFNDRLEVRVLEVSRMIIAGWTGKDEAALQEHISELRKIGVAPPVRTPMFYRVASNRVTTASAIEVMGAASSGEVEYFLINIDGKIWVGTGSDHTDREAETIGVTLAKQMCDKPVALILKTIGQI